MNSKNFLELVYKSVLHDKCNLYEACNNVKDHYQIDDEDYVKLIKSEKTLKNELMFCCIDLRLVKEKKRKSKNIDALF